MPTQKPRITFTIDEDKYEQLEYYRYAYKMKNQTQAIVSLIDKGLEVVETAAPKKNPAISAEAMKVAKDYDELPGWGQHIVRGVISDVKKGVDAFEEEIQAMQEPDIQPEKVIPLFDQRFAAGSPEPDLDLMWEDYTVPADSPAEFAIHVHGTSMEPYLPDGSIALGVRRKPKHGEVGALVIDGEYLVKQILFDHIGNLYLISANRKEADKDKTFWLKDLEDRTLSYIGTIITDKKVPLPRI